MLQNALQVVKGQLDVTLNAEANQKKALHDLNCELGQKVQDLIQIHQKIKNSLK